MSNPRPQGNEILMRYVRDLLFGLRTLTPAIIISVDRDGPDKPLFATVQPLMKETINLPGAKPTDFPQIDRVPIIMPRTRNAVLNLPVEAGDIVALIVSDRSLDNWLQSNEGVTVDPQDIRSHQMTDAVCVPGFYPFTFSDPTLAEQTDFGLFRRVADADVSKIAIDSTGNVNVSTNHNVNVAAAASVNVTAATVNVDAGEANVNTTGDTNINAGGDILVAGEAQGTFWGEAEGIFGSTGQTYLGAKTDAEKAVKGETFSIFFDRHKHICPFLGESGKVEPGSETSTEPDMISIDVSVGG